MREILFKHLTSAVSRKKNIFLREVVEHDGVTARTERRCFYFIKNIARLEDDGALQGWLDAQGAALNTGGHRRFHILKEHNDAHAEDRVSCRISGTFYVVVDGTVYTIGFIHSFKARFVKASLTK